MRAQPTTPEQRNCIANIYAQSGQFDQLLQEIEPRSPEVIHRYHTYLLPRYGANLYIMYLDWLQSRLVGYLGPIPASQVQAIVADIKNVAPELAKSLTTDLIKNNPGRIALHNQLNELWHEHEN